MRQRQIYPKEAQEQGGREEKKTTTHLSGAGQIETSCRTTPIAAMIGVCRQAHSRERTNHIKQDFYIFHADAMANTFTPNFLLHVHFGETSMFVL